MPCYNLIMYTYLAWTFRMVSFESCYTSNFTGVIIFAINNALPQFFAAFRETSIKIIIIFRIIAKANRILTVNTPFNTVGVTWARFNNNDLIKIIGQLTCLTYNHHMHSKLVHTPRDILMRYNWRHIASNHHQTCQHKPHSSHNRYLKNKLILTTLKIHL